MTNDQYRTSSNRVRSTSWLLVVPALVAIALHWHTVDDWWLDDDPQVLIHARDHTPTQVLFDPGAWQTLSTSNYTPLVTISFDIDLALFGLDPRPFHIHNLFAVAACGVLLATFLLLVLKTPAPLAAIAAAVWLATSPVISTAGQLMVRHYFIAVAFSLLSLILWHRSLESGRIHSSLLAALSYFIAVLAKEIAAPLLLVLVVMAIPPSSREIRKRLTLLVPIATVAVLYVLLRFRMLGSTGGYGELDPFDSLLGVWNLTVGAGHVVAIIGAAALLALCAIFIRQAPRRATVALASSIAVLFPLVAVIDPAPRHAIVPSLAAVVIAAISWPLGGIIARSIILVLVSTLLTGGVTQLARVESEVAQMQAEGRFAIGDDRKQILLAGSPGWYLEGLQDLTGIVDDPNRPKFVLSRHGLILSGVDLDSVVVSTPEGTLRKLSNPEREAIIEERARRDPSLPVEVVMQRAGNAIEWSFGPECRCSWVYLSLPGYDEQELPDSGRRLLPASNATQRYAVRRIEIDGAWNVSDVRELP